jgi:hypothetical protein
LHNGHLLFPLGLPQYYTAIADHGSDIGIIEVYFIANFDALWEHQLACL